MGENLYRRRTKVCLDVVTIMKINLFNHWFKLKVPIENHIDQIQNNWWTGSHHINLWGWLNDEYDVGQYYNWKEGKNYLVFHDEKHYLMFLLKL